MISWVVASHQRTVLEENLLATLTLLDDDELVVVEGAISITAAYAEGQDRATQPIRCYVHHDVQILDNERLRQGLLDFCPFAGMVGVIGTTDRRMPWWDGPHVGSVEDTRHGVLGTGRTGECAILDGLLLATGHRIEWDLEWPGWHGYDHDACMQLLSRGLPNWCLGGPLVRHNTAGPTDPDQISGWHDALARYRAKWGD